VEGDDLGVFGTHVGGWIAPLGHELVVGGGEFFNVGTHEGLILREIGGMLAVLGGLDAIVFTAGVGENSVPLRKAVCERLAFLGLKLDTSKNAQPKLDEDVAAPDSKVRVLIIRANEEWQIAKECQRLVTGA